MSRVVLFEVLLQPFGLPLATFAVASHSALSRGCGEAVSRKPGEEVRRHASHGGAR